MNYEEPKAETWNPLSFYETSALEFDTLEFIYFSSATKEKTNRNTLGFLLFSRQD